MRARATGPVSGRSVAWVVSTVFAFIVPQPFVFALDMESICEIASFWGLDAVGPAWSRESIIQKKLLPGSSEWSAEYRSVTRIHG